jgi:hypothetical protein
MPPSLELAVEAPYGIEVAAANGAKSIGPMLPEVV